MQGGLESLKIMATTPGMEESFPELADAERVDRWVKSLDRQLEQLGQTPATDLGRSLLVDVVDEVVRSNGLTVHLPAAVVYREFGDGAMHKLDELYHDPYSEIVWPVELRRFRQQTEGNFIGVGILIRHNEKREIQVVNPLEGTPAYFAGVKPDDIIVEVNGESSVGWSLNDAVDRITGPKGERVVLGIRREGMADLLQIPIDRDIIKLRTVKGWWKERLQADGEPVWDWYIDPASRIAYVRLTQFTEDTYDDLRAAWAEITQAGRPTGLIVDLRYNPGGLLTSAVEIANLFVPRGLIVSGEDKYGRKAFPDQVANPQHADLVGVPTVVLINKGSASASEIVAGCLQAHGAALVVGERSYGKGSVQTVHHISSKAKMKLTTHFYRLPPAAGEEKGRLVHKRPGSEVWGVDPDIEVKMTSTQVADSLKLRQDADIIPDDAEGRPAPASPDRVKAQDILEKGLDPQLQTALLIIQARALADMSLTDHHARR
jgi:carboxyl-terminal processing protease